MYDPSLNRCKRKSIASSIVVDIACVMADGGDVQGAAKFLAMSEFNISIDTAMRVLLRPKMRRK